jgi:DHA1 family bicyclomycin/chloramphenicol resistance-like MFS transporter
VQSALAAFVAAFAIGQLILGPLSDRLGRRPVLLGGLILFILATAAMLVVSSVPQLIGARMLQGLGACAAYALARAIVRDVWKQHAGPALAMTMFGMLVVVMIAPVLGGSVATWFGSWKAVIGLTVIIGLLALAAVLVFYRESNLTPDAGAARPATLFADYLDLLADVSFRAFAFAIACTYGALFAFIAGSSYVLVGLHGLTPTQYGLIFGVIVSGLIVGTLTSRYLVERLGPGRLVATGVTIVAVSGCISFLLSGVAGFEMAGLIVPQIVMTFGAGLVLPGSVMGAIMPNAHRAGLAAGFMGFAQMAGATAAGLLLAQLHSATALPMLAIQTGFALGAFMLFHFYYPRTAYRAIASH